jgi:hypothetical protein
MNLYDFLLKFVTWHPFITVLLMVLVYESLKLPFTLFNRWVRSRNIKNAGWPPPYVDADGDLKPEDY